MTKPSNTEFTGWCLDDPIEKAPVKDMLPDWALPMLTTPDKWKNYSDDAVYEADKRIRKWIASMGSKWKSSAKMRRYTFRMLSEILGLDDVTRSQKNYANIAKVFAYYSTRIIKDTNIGKKRAKKVYVISPTRLKKPPYSLRLRLEELDKEGAWQTFRLPKDDLEPGHARNPRTDANMQRRSEIARERANAVLREWRESHSQSEPSSDAR